MTVEGGALLGNDAGSAGELGVRAGASFASESLTLNGLSFVEVDGATVTTGALVLQEFASLVITGDASVTARGGLRLLGSGVTGNGIDHGLGSLRVSGGVFAPNDGSNLYRLGAAAASGNGSYVELGAGATANFAAGVEIGASQVIATRGKVELVDDAAVDSSFAILGRTGGFGEVEIGDAASTWTNQGHFWVGDNGTGYLRSKGGWSVPAG